jgi:hypothetical protein
VTIHRTAIAVVALTLCSCGGGNSGDGSAVVTPTPTPAASPTPSPTPTPAPSPSPTPFLGEARDDELTKDVTFRSACVVRPESSNRSVVPDPRVLSWPDGLQFAYTNATKTWLVTGDGISFSFGEAQRDPFYKRQDFVFFERLSDGIRMLFMGGITFAIYRIFPRLLARGADGTQQWYDCLSGLPTRPGDLPTTSSVTYRQASVSFLRSLPDGYGGFTVLGGAPATNALRSDFGAGSVSVAFDFTGSGTADIGAYGAISGTGTIDTGSGGFSGSLTSADPNITGRFSGAFFGPQAAEASYAFALVKRNADGSRASFITGQGGGVR